jgi:ribosomal protein S18 acetylase RimI-like enzyme
LKADALNDNVLIRDFRKSDLDDLLRLLPVCNAEEFEASGFDPDHVRGMVNRWFGWGGRFLFGLLRLFGKRPLKFLAAETDGKLVGTTIVEDRGKWSSISVVMVDPDFRRRGIATRLMTRALEYVRQRGKVRAVLGVLSTNVPAMDMYVKLGFRAFENSICFVGETGSFVAPEDVDGVVIRPFRNDDLDEVYTLVEASEDPVRLKMYDFRKSSLKTPFLARFFRTSKEKKFVAAYNGRIVGYAKVSYTTPNEVGRIGFVHANIEGKKLGVEKLLVNSARREVENGGVNRFRIIVPSTQQELVETVKALGFKKAFAVDGMTAEFS